ncbi:TIGR01777 family oxidoreductase [Rothia sp. LK2588]|uniref:TIGR01777 family oxidoreductase n=1 Tax=Rothia sp. LK2588 TaxID=3114369 RepID=UPI0034CDB982
MSTFTTAATVPYSLSEVLAWHARPGALTRLNPHWAGAVIREATREVGSRAEIKAAVPGTRGLASVPLVAEVAAVNEHSFTDRMVKGPFRSWQHTHRFSEAPTGGTLIEDEIEYELLPGQDLAAAGSPRTRGAGSAATKLVGGARSLAASVAGWRAEKYFAAMFAERTRRLEADLAFHARYSTTPQTVVIAGASGLIGQQVAALLSSGGHTVRTLVRREPRAEHEFAWDPARGTIDEAAFTGADAVIHLGGTSISTRFTEANKQKMLDSRVQSTELLAATLARLAPHGGPRTFVCTSAIGYYGASRPQELLEETSRPGSDFLARVCQAWEDACQPARDAGLRVVNVRVGVVLSALGGALRLQLPPFLAGLGASVGAGDNVQSWIGLDDIAGVFAHAVLTDAVEGPLNAVAPTPVTARKLAKLIGKVVRRPVFLKAPQAAPKLLLGEEGADQLAMADQTVSCDKLQASGYRFFAQDATTALHHELG